MIWCHSRFDRSSWTVKQISTPIAPLEPPSFSTGAGHHPGACDRNRASANRSKYRSPAKIFEKMIRCNSRFDSWSRTIKPISTRITPLEPPSFSTGATYRANASDRNRTSLKITAYRSPSKIKNPFFDDLISKISSIIDYSTSFENEPSAPGYS
jgi:hypothetical protein